ncbi:unnamed protein product [Plutella xylostella]|uniref:(diamondback moth) hypothetical protein n=1 Tax=Plutella xylostella TaxID=51655 RepID=A0A8S4FNY5_PLUXY|nr:unnamed protein product [Plutella xylostella]
MAAHLSRACDIALIGDINQLPYIDRENLFELRTKDKIKLHDSVPHAVVALSRHTTTCTYYADDTEDAIGNLAKTAITAPKKRILGVSSDEMGMRALWFGTCWLILTLCVSGSGSDWLSCAQIAVCTCKWSSGKKPRPASLETLNNCHGSPQTSKELRILIELDLSQNDLFQLSPDTFRGNEPAETTLTLSENPWYCDCRLREFHEWFLNSNVGNEEVTCGGPETNAHSSWRSVRGDEMVCPPEAISSPTVIRTEAGADISFGCFARGDPKPEIDWYFHSVEVLNETYKNSEIIVHRHTIEHYDEYNDDFINKSAQWLNVTINNVTSDLAGEWACKAKSSVGIAKVYLTLVLPKARIAKARVAPDYSAFFAVAGSILGMTGMGFLAACFCWKTRRRRVPPSRSFTDQEKKLLDTSLAVSCDRTSAELGSSYGFEMLDRSMSLESEDTQRCLEPVQITIEPHGGFPPPPAEFSFPAPYGNIFISVQVKGHNDEYPDLLGGGATLPRRSRTCFLKSDYDNMGPRITAAGSSVWSLPGSNDQVAVKPPQEPICLSTFSTEFTAL